MTRTISTAPFRFLGDISYAVYILQKPVGWAYKFYVIKTWHITTDREFWGYIAVLLLASYASSKLIEKPGRRLIFWVATRVSSMRQEKQPAAS